MNRNYSNRNKLVKIMKFNLSFLIKIKLHAIYHVLALDVIEYYFRISFLSSTYIREIPRTFYFYNEIFIISIDMTDILIYLVFSWGRMIAGNNIGDIDILFR